MRTDSDAHSINPEDLLHVILFHSFSMFKLRMNGRSAEKSVVLVHSIFRHADRTPDKSHIYPNDPHANSEYYKKIGYGNLTKLGIEESFQLGHFLRSRYQKLLGDTYYPGLIDPWSSTYDRTKCVLMLVLAALFPPNEDQTWNNQLRWQPIPFKYFEGKSERLFLNIVNCPKANGAYVKFLESPEAKLIIDKHRKLCEFLTKNSGRDVYTTRDALFLAATLLCEENMGLALPKWTEEIWPKKIEDFAAWDYIFMTADTTLKSYSMGLLLQKIVDDTKTKIEGKSECKMHIYSAHDVTVAMLMRCLNIYYLHVPKFCALLLLELHKIDGVYGFKVFYQESGSAELKQYTIPNCPTFCPLNKFTAVIQDVLDENKKIYSSS